MDTVLVGMNGMVWCRTTARGATDAVAPNPPQFDDIETAARRLGGHVVETPVLESEALNARAGVRVLIKAESLQRTGSFKIRGALNRLALIPEDRREAGVVAFSSGNHARGVAAAARHFGMPATIVMPRDAPAVKRAGTEALGARIVPYDRTRESREDIAARIAEKTGATLVPSFDDPDVIAGQGTVGLEFAIQVGTRGLRLDALLVPVSGGGLLAGCALAFACLSPPTRLFAVEPEGFDDLARSLKAGRRRRNRALAGSICDALLAPSPGAMTFPILKQHLAGAFAVSDAEVIEAMGFAARELKLVVEPSGAVALAAVLAGKLALPDASGAVGVVLSGGNVDAADLCALIAAGC